MSVPEIQARVKGRVWQAIAQSGVDLSSIPQTEQDKLVTAIAGVLLLEVDDLLGEATVQSRSDSTGEGAVPSGETVLWEGRPFLKIGVKYQITNERVRITRGLMGKEREDIELVRIQDVDHTQSMGERLVNVGDIQIRSHDPSSPFLTLENVPDPQEVHEILRRAVLGARKTHNLSYREEM